MPKSLEDLNSKVFREQLHTQFKVQTGAQPLQLELIEVADTNESPKMECFSLYLRGPIKPRLEQKIHRLEHERLGEFEIFLTAVSGDAQGTVYESVFHRFRKQP